MQINGYYDFEDVFTQINYDWGFTPENLIKDSKGNFIINKTYITPQRLFYKEWTYELKEGVFEKVQMFYEMLTNYEFHPIKIEGLGTIEFKDGLDEE